mmetsp:Transcript_25147/g.41730  ORF Transcript_25147/g.41730 Transcript_25147/m.41730 type:complete len:236 (+) Transcript_25147:86-793(+)
MLMVIHLSLLHNQELLRSYAARMMVIFLKIIQVVVIICRWRVVIISVISTGGHIISVIIIIVILLFGCCCCCFFLRFGSFFDRHSKHGRFFLITNTSGFRLSDQQGIRRFFIARCFLQQLSSFGGRDKVQGSFEIIIIIFVPSFFFQFVTIHDEIIFALGATRITAQTANAGAAFKVPFAIAGNENGRSAIETCIGTEGIFLFFRCDDHVPLGLFFPKWNLINESSTVPFVEHTD